MFIVPILHIRFSFLAKSNLKENIQERALIQCRTIQSHTVSHLLNILDTQSKNPSLQIIVNHIIFGVLQKGPKVIVNDHKINPSLHLTSPQFLSKYINFLCTQRNPHFLPLQIPNFLSPNTSLSRDNSFIFFSKLLNILSKNWHKLVLFKFMAWSHHQVKLGFNLN